MSGWPETERRQHIRASFRDRLKVCVVSASHAGSLGISAQGCNISRQGMAFFLPAAMSCGDPCLLSFKHGGQEQRMAGATVVYCRQMSDGDYLVGVRLHEPLDIA